MHLEKAWAAVERGELVLAGALTEPVDSAVLLLRAESRSVPEAFADRPVRAERPGRELGSAGVDDGGR